MKTVHELDGTAQTEQRNIALFNSGLVFMPLCV